MGSVDDAAVAGGAPGARAARGGALLVLALALVALRGEHATWLTRVPEGRALWVGLAARLLVLAGGLAFVRLVVDRPPRLPRMAPTLRGVAYLAVGYLAALCLQPYDRSAAITWAAAAAGLLVCGIAWGPHVAARRPRLARALDVVFANVCLTLVALELALAVLGATSRSPLLDFEDDGSGRAGWERFRLEPGSEHLGFPVNAWGDVDDPPRPFTDEECGVVMIGDSFSTGAVPRPYHFSEVAERTGPCEIYNMGAPSIGPPEYLYLLRERATRLEPDAFVVNLYLFNDVADVERPEAQRPPFLSRERRRTYRVGERLLTFWGERSRAGRALTGAPVSRRGGDLESRHPWLEDVSEEWPTFTPEAYLRIQTENAERALGRDSPYWPAFLDSLEALIDAGRGKLLFVLIPAEPQVEDALWREVTAASEVPLDRERAHRRLGEWLRERGVPHLDLLPVLRSVEPLEDGRRHVYHLRDTHLNARGNRVVGEALAAFLAEHVER